MIGIYAPPGSRLGFLNAFLTNNLTVEFETKLGPRFYKMHHYTDGEEFFTLSSIQTRIRIDLSYDLVDRLTYLFLHKNVYPQLPDFTKDPYCLESFTKLTRYLGMELDEEKIIDDNKLMFDYRFPFKETFNIDSLITLYQNINNEYPPKSLIVKANETIKLNQPQINKNHACSIVQLVFQKERELGVLEKDRHWSIVDAYNNTPTEELYNTIDELITIDNYSH